MARSKQGGTTITYTDSQAATTTFAMWLKVAGVRAGKIAGFKLDRKSYRALVKIDITQQGFDRFRSDAFCESRPQSLIVSSALSISIG